MLVWHRGEAKSDTGGSVLCESEQQNPAAHPSYYGTSASGRGARASGTHLSLFDSMFNDRLTKGLRMRAGIFFFLLLLPPTVFQFDCSTSVFNVHNLILIWFFQLGYQEGNSKLGRVF